MALTFSNSALLDAPLISQTRADHDFAVGTVISNMRADVSYPFTLDILAEIANYSPFHFARLFRQTTGIPPGEFLAALRFERAKNLILRTDVSITDICFEVGFSSLGTFSARFKHLVGVSPIDLRAMPELLARRLPELAEAEPVLPSRTGVTMTGSVRSPAPSTGHLFVGLFPAAIPQGPPAAGARICGPGAFTLQDVPFGTYRLMAALFPESPDPLDHLLPGFSLQVGVDPKPVVVSPGESPRELNLGLRPYLPTDPPILTALAPMALNLQAN
jgi:AraC-like DNA-binding protein